MELSVIVVNYRTPETTVSCLGALVEELKPGDGTIVNIIDNDSGDNSVQYIEAAIKQLGCERWVRCLRSPSNRGFSAGNNCAFAVSEADYYLLLNSDTVIRPGAVRALLDAASRYPEAGIIAPTLEWPDGRRQVSTFRYHSPWSELIRAANSGPLTRLLRNWDVPYGMDDRTGFVDWVSFACVLIRGEVIDTVGLMDDGYFLYFEDVDYCRRVNQSGYGILYWPEAHIVHLRGGSAPVKRLMYERSRLPLYYYCSRSRYFKKFYGRKGLFLANIFWSAGRVVSFVREVAQRHPSVHCKMEWKDIWAGFL